MKTLIIEFQTSGHYPEYLKHVLTKIDKTKTQENFIIYLTPSLRPHLKEFEATEINKSISYFDQALDDLYHGLTSTKQMAELYYQQILEIQTHQNFGHVLFLNLSLVIQNFNLLNPFKKLPFTFSGILMNSPYRIREQKKNLLLQFKRELPLRLLTWNRKCTKLFLLNDNQGVNFYRKWSSKVNFIIDPVRVNDPSQLDIHDYHNINKSKITFLQIGKLGTYKGTLDIINVFFHLNQKFSKEIQLLLIGKINRNTTLFNGKVKSLQESNMLSIRDEFVADDDFSAYMQQCDVVLITNKNVENSSGIVNHCLANNKVVIAPDRGFYKQVFKNYNAVVNYSEHFSLKDAIIYSIKNLENLKNKAKLFDNKTFIQENSSDKFSNLLLEHLL